MAFKKSNTERFNAIMNARVVIGLQHVGEIMKLTIQSAKYSFYDEKNDLVKDIYNTNASKATVLRSAWFDENYKKALELEKAGATEEAGVIFEDLMNKSSLSFSVINADGMKYQFSKDERINAPIEMVKAGEDQHDSVVISKPYPVKATAATKDDSFKFTTVVDVPAPATKPSVLSSATTQA